MNHFGQVEQIARARLQRSKGQIAHSVEAIREGNPLAAEWDQTRLVERLQAKAQLTREEAEVIRQGIRAMAELKPEARTAVAGGPEAIWGKTIDFVGVAFLERGLKASRSVGRIAYHNGRAQGTGFMVSDRLLLTNNHVIETAQLASNFVIEFDYELDPTDRPRSISRFALDASTFYLFDDVDDLDYALVAVGPKISGPGSLADFSYCALSAAKDKHALGEVANIVQHPDGRYKEVVLRENSLVARLDYVLHYIADTEPGASGSPVFNNDWQVIALHHWGGPWRQTADDAGRPLKREINEGIRISAIVHDLEAKLGMLGPAQQQLLRKVLSGGGGMVHEIRREQPTDAAQARIASDGSITWVVPLEVSVRLPLLAQAPAPPPATGSAPIAPLSAEALRPSTEYSSRSGYKPNFIQGFIVPLPELSASQKNDAAENLQADPGDDPYELRYHHFSVVMNKKRRLAFFTACNIDGKTAKNVNRKTGAVSVLRADDPGLEAVRAEGAEASEPWYNDERLDEADFAGKDVYEGQIVPGFPNTRDFGRTLRMFQRGHLVRRMDPAWGTDSMALKADADTFHWTNCSPQVGFFNTGTSLWRAVENIVLRNAVAEDQRVCSFTGPVFRTNDRRFRSIKVPMKFWKIAVWAEDGHLRSLAMVANQKPVIDVWPENLESAGSEAFGDPAELDKVEDHLSTIAEIESLTGLDFGSTVRDGDIRAGGGSERARAGDVERLVLNQGPKPRPASKKRAARKKR